MPTVTVSSGPASTSGFRTSRSHAVGCTAALVSPRDTAGDLVANSADEIVAPDPLVREYAHRAVELLDVPGVEIVLEERLPRHVGLGSGTQLALSVLAGTARAHGLEPRVRDHAPAMGRGGRSGVGVATFEAGGFVVDAGHPTARFTTEPPAEGDWTVPPVVSRHDLPQSGGFSSSFPTPSRDGTATTKIEVCEPSSSAPIPRSPTKSRASSRGNCFRPPRRVASRSSARRSPRSAARTVAGTRTHRAASSAPAGELVEALEHCRVLSGVGQSSGPVVYGVTDRDHADEAAAAAEDALADRGLEGRVVVSAPATDGARIRVDDPRKTRGFGAHLLEQHPIRSMRSGSRAIPVLKSLASLTHPRKSHYCIRSTFDRRYLYTDHYRDILQ